MSETDRFIPLHRGGQGPPLVCLHGFTDTCRSWELVLTALERHHDVLAPTLAGHAGGPPWPEEANDDTLVEAVEQAMDEAGFHTAHVVGNSLGVEGRRRATEYTAVNFEHIPADLLAHQIRGPRAAGSCFPPLIGSGCRASATAHSSTPRRRRLS